MNTSLTLLFTIILSATVILALPVKNEPEEEWMAMADMYNRLHYVNLRQIAVPLEVSDDNITYYYFSRKTYSEELHLKTVNKIKETDFDPTRKTMFIIHGWISNGQSELNNLITDALLDVGNWNIFNVDWHTIAKKSYAIVKASTPGVANVIVDFINHLAEETGLDMHNLYITGHSLGAHVAGIIGSRLKESPAIIIGLDPAFPMFNNTDLSDRLDKSDAKYVHVIHTNGGLLGYIDPIGDADFYPNGGAKQKGCGVDFFGVCAHSRSYMYFAESIRTNKFLSRACSTYEDFTNGNCGNSNFTHMGGMQPDITAMGSYYLDTAETEPFGLS